MESQIVRDNIRDRATEVKIYIRVDKRRAVRCINLKLIGTPVRIFLIMSVKEADA